MTHQKPALLALFAALAIKGLTKIWPYTILMSAFGLRKMDMDKTLDGITRTMAGFGIEVSPYIDKIATYYEEITELGMATALAGLAPIWTPNAHTTTPEGA